jgi:3-methyladenine DNA glycosylase Mpg
MVLNVVADKQGVRAAVLIRSRAPVSGMHCSLIPYRYLPANDFVHAQMY